MRRRVTVTSILFLALVAFAPGIVQATYVGSCSSGTQAPAYNGYFTYIDRTGGEYDGVIGDGAARPLLLCTSPTSSAYSYPIVQLAGLAQTYNGNNIVQLGFMKCGKSSGKCGDPTNGVPNDGLVRFWYTKVDNSGGVIYDAFSWYPSVPVFGHRYRAKISQVNGGNHSWQYCLRDITAGEASVCHTEPIHWSYAAADAVTWLGEVQNTNAGMGPSAGASNQLDLYWMQYNKNNDLTWYVATNNVIEFSNYTNPPAYWQEAVFSQNYTNDGFRFWTADH